MIAQHTPGWTRCLFRCDVCGVEKWSRARWHPRGWIGENEPIERHLCPKCRPPKWEGKVRGPHLRPRDESRRILTRMNRRVR